MKEELGTWGAVVGAVVLACLFGGLTLAIYPGWKAVGDYLPAISGWSEVIAAFSAIGTFAAVFAALWISGKQTREDNRRRLDTAQLYAASMAGGLSESEDYVRSVAIMIAFSKSNPELRDLVLEQACEALEAPIKRPSAESLAALIPLPNSCAHRIARAYDLIEVVQTQAATYQKLRIETYRTVADPRSLHDRWVPLLMQASDLLRVATVECVRAAESGAPTPTALELFGEWHDDE